MVNVLWHTLEDSEIIWQRTKGEMIDLTYQSTLQRQINMNISWKKIRSGIRSSTKISSSVKSFSINHILRFQFWISNVLLSTYAAWYSRFCTLMYFNLNTDVAIFRRKLNFGKITNRIDIQHFPIYHWLVNK